MGLLLGLGFTFAVVFLFERGIPQRWMRDGSAGPSPPDLFSARVPSAPAVVQDAGLSDATVAALSSPPPSDAGSRPGNAQANTAASNVEAPKQSDTEALREPGDPWPLWALQTPRPGSELQLPPGSHVLSLDLDPRGEQAALVLAARSGERSLHRWRFDNELPSLLRADAAGNPSAERASTTARELPIETAWSRFGAGLFVLLQAGAEWRIELLSPTQTQGATAAFSKRQVLYRSRSRLSNLVTSGALYASEERIFFAREYAREQWQILTVMATGKRWYEVTSASGSMGQATDPAIRTMDFDDELQRPKVLRVRSAKPVSVNPATSRLIFADASGALSSLEYAYANWADKSERLPMAAGTQLRDTPNAALLLRRTSPTAAIELVDSLAQYQVLETLAPDGRLVGLPVSAPTGRSVVAVVARGDREFLTVLAVKERFAHVRYLHHLGTGTLREKKAQPEIRAQLRRRGLWLATTTDEQLHQVYEGLEYTECGAQPNVPIFASIDGFLEILAAGFQATFMVTEQLVSIPRMRRFLRELERVAAGQTVLSRIGKIAAETQAMLKGDYGSDEAKRVLAEKSAPSTLHSVPSAQPIAFALFHPRGPYVATDGLKNYFRAFMYLSELRATPEELRLLDGDAALRLAWRAWVETQSALLFDTRLPLLFEPDRALPSYVQRDCVPAELRAHPRLFPLAFGIDSEIWHQVTAHSGLSASCQVAERPLPSGLDLLTALGSDEAQAIQSPEYARLPALRDAHDRLRRRFGRPLSTERVAESWLRLVQLLSTDRLVPEGIEPTLWRRRLLQTALASWTNYRHTTVLLNENIAAECGGDGPGFEELLSEPLRGVVDPLPESWEQLSRTLAMLADHSGKLLPDQPELGTLLRESSTKAQAFGRMAARQIRGLPLRASEYQDIQFFSGAIEHPYVKFKTLLAQAEQAGLLKPEPMTKIVDVAHAAGQFFHLGVGSPLQVIGLFGDRGVLVPASGGVYSYHELVADRPLDDQAWRSRLEPPLPWTPQALMPAKGADPAAGGAGPSVGAAPAKPQ